MELNAAGLALIKEHEGLRLNAYPDPGTGGEPWTIGYGHTSAAGAPKVFQGMRILQQDAEDILKRDLKKFERAVAARVKVPLNDNQFSALVSFCFNVGEGNFEKSSVLREVNAKRFANVPSKLAMWNKAAGKVMKGLVRRRADEGRLFMKTAGPMVQVDDDDVAPSRTPVDKPTGKPIAKSRTVFTQFGQWLAAGGAAALGALGQIDWKTALALGAVAAVIGTIAIIYLKKQDGEG